MSACPRSFDETLISGYLDHALPQQEAQRVRLHLEDCPTCGKLHGELLEMREVALATRFKVPPDDGWPELPQTLPSRLTRSLGVVLLAVWVVVTGGVMLWRFLAHESDPLTTFLWLGLPGALLMLFISALLDRLRALPTDRYRGVHR